MQEIVELPQVQHIVRIVDVTVGEEDDADSSDSVS